MVYGNGDRYEGKFRDDMKKGNGTFVDKDGNKYEGEWRDDKKDGNGITLYNTQEN